MAWRPSKPWMSWSLVTASWKLDRADRNEPRAEIFACASASAVSGRGGVGAASACTSFCTMPWTSRPEPTPLLVIVPCRGGAPAALETVVAIVRACPICRGSARYLLTLRQQVACQSGAGVDQRAQVVEVT